MSYAWWNDKHNRHHANPNHIDKDPDVVADVLVFTGEQAKERVGLPALAHPQPGLAVLPAHPPRRRRPEDPRLPGPAPPASAGARGGGPAAGGPRRRVRDAAARSHVPSARRSPSPRIHQALFGLHLGLAFAPNHKGMEMPDPDGERWGHLQPPGAHLAQHPRRRRSPTGSWAASTTRSSTTCSPACPAPICGSPSPWCAPTARSWVCPTRRPDSSTPTGRPCATCTRWGSRCGSSSRADARRGSGCTSGSRLRDRLRVAVRNRGRRGPVSQDRERQWPRRRRRTCRRTRRSPQGVWRPASSC